MRRRKKKKKEVLTCKFCKHFQLAKLEKKDITEAGIFIHVKKCTQNKDKTVSDNTPICKDNFEPYPYIFCRNYNNRMPLRACINRLDTRKCVKCKLRKYILKLREYLNE